jgi:putative peptide zinc metalloprotease protein
MSFSPAVGSASDSDTPPDQGGPGATRVIAAPAPQAAAPERTGRHAGTSLSVADHVPQLLPGVELAGEYQGSGLAETTYLVLKPGGQSIQVSRLLYLVLEGIDGIRTVSEVAERTSAAFGREVSADNIGYLVASKLEPLGLVPGGGAHSTPPAEDQPLLGLKLRRTMIREGVVQRLAGVFKPLFHPVVVVIVLASLIGSDAYLVRGGRLSSSFQYVLLHPVLLLIVLGLAVASMMFHECGHAAACRYGGARPGVIGVGFYLIWPAFYTNVTDAYRLGRVGRIRTDLGGVYFNAVFMLPLIAGYLKTGYLPLLAAVFMIHLEMMQQLMPSLRLDGYFILADLIGVPDLFKRIGPVLRSVIPGQPVDPRIRDLKRGARLTLTTWILIVLPLLLAQLTLIVMNAPTMVGTSARSLDEQVREFIAAFAQGDIPAGAVGVISAALLVMPIAGLSYILLVMGKKGTRAAVAACRKRPVLSLPYVTAVLLVAAGLAAHWGLLPVSGGTSRQASTRTASGPQRSAAGVIVTQRPLAAQSAVPPATGPSATGPSATQRSATRTQAIGLGTSPQVRKAVTLTPVSAHGFDALDTSGDPRNENDNLAGYAIDQDPATSWQSQYYLGNPVFGGLKAGSGLIVDMGRKVRLSSVAVTFGSAPGADVSIKVGNDDTLAASAVPSFSTVAAADGIGGRHTFKATRAIRARYVLIWFTKLPPVNPGKYQAQIFSIVLRGSR